MTLHRTLGGCAVIAALGLCGGCIEDLAEKIVDRAVSKHVKGAGGGDDNSDRDGKGDGGGAFGIPNAPKEPSGKIAQASQTDECRADLAAGLETIKEEQGLAYKVEDEHVNALITEGKVTLKYARDGVQHLPGFGLDKTDTGCDLRFYRRETIKPGHSGWSMANYGSAALTKCVCE